MEIHVVFLQLLITLLVANFFIKLSALSGQPTVIGEVLAGIIGPIFKWF
jgi:Kef-type K+ transport system membrane component KefB